MAMDLKAGDKAPAFKLPSTNGKDISLSELKGKKVVLYFYPKDDTPGCTRQACDFRDQLGAVKKSGAVVLGVSKDSLSSHDKFRDKYGLPFDLLFDDENKIAKAYGAYGEKKMYGKAVVGTIRSTVLIGEDGKIERVWSPVKVDGHVDKVLAALRGEEAPAKPKVSSAAKRTMAPPKTALPKKS